MIDLIKSHSKQKQSITPQTKKQAFEQANVNSMLHIEKQGNTLVASLYIEPLESLSNIPDSSKGRNRFLTVRQGRRMRARSLQKDTQAFFTALQWDISGILQKAVRDGCRVVLRLPVMKGVQWPDYDGGIVTQESFFMA